MGHSMVERMRSLARGPFWLGLGIGAAAAAAVALALGGGGGGSSPPMSAVASVTATSSAAAATSTGSPAAVATTSLATDASALRDQLQTAQGRIKALEDPERPVVTLGDGTKLTAQQAADRIAQLQNLDAFAPYLSCASLLSPGAVSDAAVQCMRSIAPFASP